MRIELGKNSYDIVIRRGVLAEAAELLELNRKVLILTDSGVPEQYAEAIAAQCKCPVSVCVPQGEASKSIAVWEDLLKTMTEHCFTRADAVVAVGGGVVGDLAGFTAASYMRGIDFYNIPTTLLAQVDSSVGGKTALNLNGIKNVVGAFYQPKKVLIDPNVLQTLDPRQLASGLAEAVKMAACFDAELFALIENEDAMAHIETIIERSIHLKAAVVEQDEKEAGLRKVLNFGHTFGHAIEANSDLYHGECVALGMLKMSSPAVQARLKRIYARYGLPCAYEADEAALKEALRHDKKTSGEIIDTVFVESIGSYEMRAWKL